MAYQTKVTVRETTNTAISFQLLAGTVPINLSAANKIEMFLRDNAGGTVGYTDQGGGAKLSITAATSGSVDFTPGSANLVAGSAPYAGYFKVYPTSTTWYFVPEDSEFTIEARPVF